MKITLLIFIALFATGSVKSQDITGQWSGSMEVSGIKMSIVFNITKSDSGYKSTLDSPDQGVKGLPISSTSFSDLTLKLEHAAAQFRYEGVLNKDNILVGKFTQGDQTISLNLSRQKIEKPARPQEPKPPFPYYSEDITFENPKDKLELAGTLTLPRKEGIFPAVVLITGSGPQNRDEELLGHKPFLVLADHLTRNGIAVLRFDDRGVAGSKGNFGAATSLDFSYDAESAVNYLKTRKEIDKRKIGLIGHSEGGQIAPMIAARSKDIGFIVLLAGPGIPGDQLLLLQKELIERASGVKESDVQIGQKIFGGAYEIVKRATAAEALKTELTDNLKMAFGRGNDTGKPPSSKLDEIVAPIVGQLSSPWMQYFIKFEPSIYLEKVRCPVLALNGGNDLQVPAKVDLAAIKSSLEKGGNNNVTTMELPGLNHLFQESKTGLPAEYGKIEQTMSPLALDALTKWIKKQVD